MSLYALVHLLGIAGEAYERVLRQQHVQLNPRTAWAQLGGNRRADRRRASRLDGDDAEAGGVEEVEEDEEEEEAAGVEALMGECVCVCVYELP